MGAERLNRSEWMVRIVPHRESKEFVERYHYSRSCSNTSVVSHGLFRLDGARTTDLVGSLGSRPQGANAKGAGGAWDGADMLAIMIEIATTSIKVLASDLFDQMVLSSDGEGGR